MVTYKYHDDESFLDNEPESTLDLMHVVELHYGQKQVQAPSHE
jgi:hypothetical protein